MRYVDFKESIRRDLQSNPGGLTWKQLRDRNQLPYDRPCPTWTRCLEEEIGLRRVKRPGMGNQLVWVVNEGGTGSVRS